MVMNRVGATMFNRLLSGIVAFLDTLGWDDGHRATSANAKDYFLTIGGGYDVTRKSIVARSAM